MLEFAILGLLHQSPMHGYELRKQLAQVLGGLRSISYGSLYPALKRMHAAGLISTDEPDPHALLHAWTKVRTARVTPRLTLLRHAARSHAEWAPKGSAQA